MRTLSHWITAALDAQPFYSEEIAMARLMFRTWCPRVPRFDLFRANR